MLVEADKYELPCSPPFDTMREIAEAYGFNVAAVAKAIKRGSKTKYGKIVKIKSI